MSETLFDHTDSTSYGSNRSIVRMIATRLPIETGQRLYIQLPGSQLSSPMVPSVGGMLDIAADEETSSTLVSLLRDPGLVLSKAAQRFRLEPIEEEETMTNKDARDRIARDKAEATEKISSLEEELSRLRSQIALYTIMEQTNVTAPPPPAPPPPPPLPDSTTTDKEIEQGHDNNTTGTPMRSVNRDINQEIGSIKLRKVNVKKSPGGTPLRVQGHQVSSREPSMDDPAAVIAHALRKKFSHRIFQDSPDKENLDDDNQMEDSFTDSPGPSKKLFV